MSAKATDLGGEAIIAAVAGAKHILRIAAAVAGITEGMHFECISACKTR